MAEKEIKTESGEALEQPVETLVVPEAEKKKGASKRQSLNAPGPPSRLSRKMRMAA